MCKNKIILFLFVISLFFVFSCRKETDKITIEVTGINHLSTRVYDTIALNLSVSQTGSPEDIELMIKDLPKGVSYSFSPSKGSGNFSSKLVVIVTDKVVLGDYKSKCVATSKSTSVEVDFAISVVDQLSMIMTVFDASNVSVAAPNCPRSVGAIVKLYKDIASVEQGKYFHTSYTDSAGVANFYHTPPGLYYFTVENGDLSNIVQKIQVSGKNLGFATVRIDNKYKLLLRDQNGDGKLTETDRVLADMLVLYANVISERIIYLAR